MYEGLRLENKRAVLFNFFFLLRRMMYVYALSLLEACSVAQLGVVNMGSLAMLSFLATVKPFKTPFLNTLELLNEATILVLSYFCFVFTDLMQNYALKFQLGWAYSLLLIAQVLLNIFAIIFSNYLKIYRKLCRKNKRRKRK